MSPTRYSLLAFALCALLLIPGCANKVNEVPCCKEDNLGSGACTVNYFNKDTQVSEREDFQVRDPGSIQAVKNAKGQDIVDADGQKKYYCTGYSCQISISCGHYVCKTAGESNCIPEGKADCIKDGKPDCGKNNGAEWPRGDGDRCVLSLAQCGGGIEFPCVSDQCSMLVCADKSYKVDLPNMPRMTSSNDPTGQSAEDVGEGLRSSAESKMSGSNTQGLIETGLVKYQCSLEKFDEQTENLFANSAGAFVDSFRFGIGKTFDEYEAYKLMFPASDSGCYIFPEAPIERYVNYLPPSSYWSDGGKDDSWKADAPYSGSCVLNTSIVKDGTKYKTATSFAPPLGAWDHFSAMDEGLYLAVYRDYADAASPPVYGVPYVFSREFYSIRYRCNRMGSSYQCDVFGANEKDARIVPAAWALTSWLPRLFILSPNMSVYAGTDWAAPSNPDSNTISQDIYSVAPDIQSSERYLKPVTLFPYDLGSFLIGSSHLDYEYIDINAMPSLTWARDPVDTISEPEEIWKQEALYLQGPYVKMDKEFYRDTLYEAYRAEITDTVKGRAPYECRLPTDCKSGSCDKSYYSRGVCFDSRGLPIACACVYPIPASAFLNSGLDLGKQWSSGNLQGCYESTEKGMGMSDISDYAEHDAVLNFALVEVCTMATSDKSNQYNVWMSGKVGSIAQFSSDYIFNALKNDEEPAKPSGYYTFDRYFRHPRYDFSLGEYYAFPKEDSCFQGAKLEEHFALGATDDMPIVIKAKDQDETGERPYIGFSFMNESYFKETDFYKNCQPQYEVMYPRLRVNDNIGCYSYIRNDPEKEGKDCKAVSTANPQDCLKTDDALKTFDVTDTFLFYKSEVYHGFMQEIPGTNQVNYYRGKDAEAILDLLRYPGCEYSNFASYYGFALRKDWDEAEDTLTHSFHMYLYPQQVILIKDGGRCAMDDSNGLLDVETLGWCEPCTFATLARQNVTTYKYGGATASYAPTGKYTFGDALNRFKLYSWRDLKAASAKGEFKAEVLGASAYTGICELMSLWPTKKTSVESIQDCVVRLETRIGDSYAKRESDYGAWPNSVPNAGYLMERTAEYMSQGVMPVIEMSDASNWKTASSCADPGSGCVEMALRFDSSLEDKGPYIVDVMDVDISGEAYRSADPDSGLAYAFRRAAALKAECTKCLAGVHLTAPKGAFADDAQGRSERMAKALSVVQYAKGLDGFDRADLLLLDWYPEELTSSARSMTQADRAACAQGWSQDRTATSYRAAMEKYVRSGYSTGSFNVLEKAVFALSLARVIQCQTPLISFESDSYSDTGSPYFYKNIFSSGVGQMSEITKASGKPILIYNFEVPGGDIYVDQKVAATQLTSEFNRNGMWYSYIDEMSGAYMFIQHLFENQKALVKAGVIGLMYTGENYKPYVDQSGFFSSSDPSSMANWRSNGWGKGGYSADTLVEGAFSFNMKPSAASCAIQKSAVTYARGDYISQISQVSFSSSTKIPTCVECSSFELMSGACGSNGVGTNEEGRAVSKNYLVCSLGLGECAPPEGVDLEEYRYTYRCPSSSINPAYTIPFSRLGGKAVCRKVYSDGRSEEYGEFDFSAIKESEANLYQDVLSGLVDKNGMKIPVSVHSEVSGSETVYFQQTNRLPFLSQTVFDLYQNPLQDCGMPDIASSDICGNELIRDYKTVCVYEGSDVPDMSCPPDKHWDPAADGGSGGCSACGSCSGYNCRCDLMDWDCISDSDCAEGEVCYADHTCGFAGRSKEDAVCRSSQECADGLECRSSDRAEYCAGIGSDQRCRPEAGQVQVGADCASQDDCACDAVCYGFTAAKQLCVPRCVFYELYEKCSSGNYNCNRDASLGYYCRGNAFKGDPCQNSAECTGSLRCVAGVCTEVSEEQGGACTSNANCIDGMICNKDKKCVPLIALGSKGCDEASDCEQPGFCRASDSKCVECLGDSQCASDPDGKKCSSSGSCGCSTHYDCDIKGGKYCDPFSDKCMPPLDACKPTQYTLSVPPYSSVKFCGYSKCGPVMNGYEVCGCDSDSDCTGAFSFPATGTPGTSGRYGPRCLVPGWIDDNPFKRCGCMEDEDCAGYNAGNSRCDPATYTCTGV